MAQQGTIMSGMELFTALKYFHEMSHFPISVFDGENPARDYAVDPFFPNPAATLTAPLISEGLSMDMTFTRDFVMCGFVKNRRSDRTIYIGPALEYPCSAGSVLGILTSLNQPFSRKEELRRYLSHIPLSSLSHFVKSLVFLNYLVNQEEPPENALNEKITSLLGPDMDYHDEEHKAVHGTEAFEKSLQSMVEHGKLEEISELLKNEAKSPGNAGYSANDTLRAYKNVFVVSVTIVSRAAIRGGLEYETALEASDRYLRSMEKMNSYDDIRALWRQMLLDYTSEVKKLQSLHANSKMVHSVAGYVSSHIYERIRLEDIAAELGYNRSYLSRAFKAESGCNLSEYINKAKVHEAQHLLKSTQYPISEISAALGFSSQNHFQTVFKQITGNTPSRYRL
jgi:AraC-like DNA-binding protein